MKRIGSQAHHFALIQFGFLGHANAPDASECSGRAAVGGVEFDSNLQRFIAQIILRSAEFDFPEVHVAGRHNLELGFDLFANLFAHIFEVCRGSGFLASRSFSNLSVSSSISLLTSGGLTEPRAT